MKSATGISRLILLATLFFYFLVLNANAISSSPLPNSLIICSTAHSPDTVVTQTIKTIAEFSASLRNPDGSLLKFKERKQLLKTQLQDIKHSPDKTRDQKVVLTILAILAFIGVVAILAIVAYNGGAGILPVIGLAIGIFLLVFVLRRIWRKRKNKNT